MKNATSTQNLNDLPFPSGYLFTNETETTEVTGRKTFKNVIGVQISLDLVNKRQTVLEKYIFNSIHRN